MLKDRLLQKIAKRSANVAIIGIGYIGLPTAAILAEVGFHVTGIDTNPRKVREVSSGQSHVREPHLRELISKAHSKGTLRATVNALKALSEADIIIVSVQTPLKKNGTPNLAYVQQVCREIGDTLAKGKLIILQSTLPPRVTRDFVIPLLEKKE